MDLRVISSIKELQENPALLSKVLRVVRDREMPPPDEAELADKDRRAFLTRLEEWLTVSLREHAAPPRTPLRRMNRFQYANAVSDLLELKGPLYWLPEAIMSDQSNYFQPQTGQMPKEVKVHNRAMGRIWHFGSKQVRDLRTQPTVPPLSDVLPPGEKFPFPQDPRASNGFDNQANLLSMSPPLMELLSERGRAIFQSEDLGPKTCGAWDKYFAAPPAETTSVDSILRKRIEAFLTSAFRQPVDADTLDRYAVFASKRLKAGDDFTSVMKAVATAAITSPRFLYLGERKTSGKRPEPLTGVELASRMSFFLWSSGPDDELLSAAIGGQLADDKTIAVQVDRMMNSVRMKRFCDAFASQWLRIESLIDSKPDGAKFKDFYKFGESVSPGTDHGLGKLASNHFMMEPLLVFETVFIENRGIDQFIHSDFSYRSQPLAKFLAGQDPGHDPGSRAVAFTRVPIASKREGGVLLTAAVMTMTSGARDTKPISRGKWIVETLFNNPPPPPPPDVPDLSEAEPDKEKLKKLTLREQFALHRTKASCASCHSKIDPFGFALENYDPVGRWRDEDANGQPIDASGVLFNRVPFQSIEQFVDGLLSEKERFARGFVGHLLRYALCRELGPTDQPAIERIVSAAAANGFLLRDIMKQVVLSEPFRMKFNPQ
ncbi:MAG: DUF1588 domain-containing protein [Verrucomicrobiota bacterium]